VTKREDKEKDKESQRRPEVVDVVLVVIVTRTKKIFVYKLGSSRSGHQNFRMPNRKRGVQCQFGFCLGLQLCFSLS